MVEGYSGAVGAYAFAFRRSRSWLFRAYVVVSALLAAYVLVLLALALVTWLANPTGVIGERALLGVVGIALLVPLTAPVLVVARRHRLGASRIAERPLALSGYALVLSFYLGLFISDPADHAAAGPLRALDALPSLYGLVPPLAAVALVALVAWLTRD